MRVDEAVIAAKATYDNETKGWKLSQELRLIAHDGALLKALSRGELTAAQAAADARLASPANHFAHVTRISVTRGSRVLVNATVNSDGVFVVAPGTRTLRSHGHLLGTLLVSLQDVTGFVKLVHRRTGAKVLVRGGRGHVRTSLGAAAHVRLPPSGYVALGGQQVCSAIVPGGRLGQRTADGLDPRTRLKLPSEPTGALGFVDRRSGPPKRRGSYLKGTVTGPGTGR